MYGGGDGRLLFDPRYCRETGGGSADPLTKRERQVAELSPEGMAVKSCRRTGAVIKNGASIARICWKN